MHEQPFLPDLDLDLGVTFKSDSDDPVQILLHQSQKRRVVPEYSSICKYIAITRGSASQISANQVVKKYSQHFVTIWHQLVAAALY
jgi:hypothetical protein